MARLRKRNLDLISALQELDCLSGFCIKVMGINGGEHSDLLDINDLLIFSCFLFTLSLFKAIFAVIHDLAYRRNSLRRNFYQIQILFCRKLLSVPCGHKTELTSVGTDYSDFLVTDFFIDLKLLAILVSYGEHPQNIKLNYK